MSVAQLKEFHDKRQGGIPPVYDYSQFTNGFQASCVYLGRKTIGCGTSKKEAQRKAAEEMLKLFNQRLIVASPVKTNASNQSLLLPGKSRHLPHQLSPLQLENADSFLREFDGSSFSKDFFTTQHLDKKVLEEVDMGLKSRVCPKSLFNEYSDAIDAFKSAMKDMELNFHCYLPETKDDEKIVFISIDFNNLMAGGTGSTVQEATYKACENAIKMIRILLN